MYAIRSYYGIANWKGLEDEKQDEKRRNKEVGPTITEDVAQQVVFVGGNNQRALCHEFIPVITSYSIHYTKLYDGSLHF